MRAELMRRMCLGKKSYPLAIAQKIVGRRNGGGVRLKSYLCPVCGNTHVARLEISEIPDPPNAGPIEMAVHSEFKRLLALYPQYGNKRLRKMARERIAVEEKYAKWKAQKNKPSASPPSANENAECRETEQGSARSFTATPTWNEDSR